MEKEKRNKVIKIVIAIIIVMIILLSIKACSTNGQDKNDALIKEDFDQLLVDTPADNKVDYIEKVSKYEESASSTTDDLVRELEKMEDPFECNEDTSLVYREYSEYFESIAQSYNNLKYVGSESVGEVDYLNKRFEYYANLSNNLKDISKAMDRKDSSSVLTHYDEMGNTLKELYGNGEVSSETN